MLYFGFLSVFLVVFLSTSTSVIGQSRPPNFSPDAIPDTNFSCEDKVINECMRMQLIYINTSYCLILKLLMFSLFRSLVDIMQI